MTLRFTLLMTALVFTGVPSAFAQTPDEHAKHHPAGENGQGDTKKKGPASRPSERGTGMMGGGMGKMMERMGAPPPRDLYPQLMRLPDLPPEERDSIRRQAHERMKAGAALMDRALGELAGATESDDFTRMQEATALLREGVAEFESGLAAHRALEEGKAPRAVALQWFRKQMNLPVGANGPHAKSGVSWFHLSAMAVLVLVALVGLWTYVSRMRRASELVQALAASRTAGPASSAETSSPVQTSAPSAATAQEARPGLPTRSWKGSLKVISTFEETPEVTTYRLAANAEGGALPFSFLAGQFLTISVRPDGAEKPIKRSYTIASAPSQQQYCELTIKREAQGLVSRYVHDQLTVGDSVEVRGPSGKFTFTGNEADSIVLLGGGVGITPLMSVIRWLCDTSWPGDIFLLYSCRTKTDIIFREELQYLEKRNPRLRVIVTLTRPDEGWRGASGRIDAELLKTSIPNLQARRVHLCGPPAFLEALPPILEGLGVASKSIKTEAFGQPPQPSSPESAKEAAPQVAASSPSVTFQPSGKRAPLPDGATVLDVADELELEIDSSCRSGTCGTCLVRLVEGEVSMDCEDGLEPEDKAKGMVLACQARSQSDVVVELDG